MTPFFLTLTPFFLTPFFSACLTSDVDDEDVPLSSPAGIVRIWDWATRRQISKLDHPASARSIAFSADSQYLLTATPDYVVRVWSLADGSERARISTGRRVFALSMAADARLAIVAANGLYVYPWQPEALMQELCKRLDRNLSREEWQRQLPGEPYHRTCPNLPG